MYEEEIRTLNELIKIDLPPKLNLYEKKCNLLYQLKRYEETVLSYEIAGKAFPKEIRLHSNYGILLYEMKRLDESYKKFE